jgi:hypothetical protein
MRITTLITLLALLILPGHLEAGCLLGNTRLDLDLVAPTDISATATELAVLEGPAHRLRVFSSGGVTVAQVDVGEKPLGLVRLDDGTYLVGDRPNGQVLHVDPVREEVVVFSGGFNGIAGLAREGNRVLVLEPSPARVIELDLSGRNVRETLLQTSASLHGLAIDTAGQRWIALDPKAARGLAFTHDGVIATEFGGFGGGDGQLARTGSVECDAAGRVYVTDRFQGTLTVFEPDAGLLCAVAAVEFDGEPLVLPTDLQVEGDGTVYVASSGSGGVHILDLDLQAVAPASARAVPVSPTGDRIVDRSRPTLVAALEAPIEGPATMAMEFELVADGSGEVIASSPALDVTSTVVEGATVRGELSWTVPAELESGMRYRWRARVNRADVVGTWSGWAAFRVDDVPNRLEVIGNRPNPFNPRTEIFFRLPAPNRVEIVIADVRGRVVRRIDLGVLESGPQSALWNGEDDHGSPVSSGVYFYLVVTEKESSAGKMVLVR